MIGDLILSEYPMKRTDDQYVFDENIMSWQLNCYERLYNVSPATDKVGKRIVN